MSALIQRLHSIVDEPLMPLDAEDDCSTGTESSATSDVCDGEQDLEGNLSHADDTCHLRQEGMLICYSEDAYFYLFIKLG